MLSYEVVPNYWKTKKSNFEMLKLQISKPHFGEKREWGRVMWRNKIGKKLWGKMPYYVLILKTFKQGAVVKDELYSFEKSINQQLCKQFYI